jgi:hypothetical protein
VGALMQNLGLVWFMVFNATFKNISVIFIGGGNWSTRRKPRLPQCIIGDDLHINKQTNICIANHTRLLRQNN